MRGITAEAVVRAVGDKKLLLVLDNCEHLIGAVATLIETFLAVCPNTTIVVTSRETLRVLGEHVYRVPPLEVPVIEAREIPSHGAAELFLIRAGELGADFSIDPKYPPLIAAICRALDGIPLAIELAAARAATLGVEQVANGLRDRFVLLTSGRRTALPRHRTLRGTLDWSYRLLSEAERDLLRRVAIFVGPFSLEAARATAKEGMAAGEIVDTITDLVSKSLINPPSVPMTEDFRLLETVRAYALEQLKEDGDHNEVAHRHGMYCLKVLGNIDGERRSKPVHDHLRASRRLADEIHVALEWAFSSAGDNGTGVALTVAAFSLWFELSQLTVVRMRADQALSYVATGSREEMLLLLGFGHAIWYMTSESDRLEPTFTRTRDRMR